MRQGFSPCLNPQVRSSSLLNSPLYIGQWDCALMKCHVASERAPTRHSAWGSKQQTTLMPLLGFPFTRCCPFPTYIITLGQDPPKCRSCQLSILSGNGRFLSTPQGSRSVQNHARFPV